MYPTSIFTYFSLAVTLLYIQRNCNLRLQECNKQWDSQILTLAEASRPALHEEAGSAVQPRMTCRPVHMFLSLRLTMHLCRQVVFGYIYLSPSYVMLSRICPYLRGVDDCMDKVRSVVHFFLFFLVFFMFAADVQIK